MLILRRGLGPALNSGVPLLHTICIITNKNSVLRCIECNEYMLKCTIMHATMITN